MDNLSILDRLFTSYLARDFLAKIIPGSLIILAAIWAIHGELSFLNDMAWGLWILAFGFSYCTGFAIQAMAEAVKWFRARPDDEDNQIPLMERSVKIYSETKFERLRAERERIVTLKEMSGNISFAGLLALGLWVVGIVRSWFSGICYPTPQVIIGILVSLIFMVAIYKLQRYHVSFRKRQRQIEEIVINKIEKTEKA